MSEEKDKSSKTPCQSNIAQRPFGKLCHFFQRKPDSPFLGTWLCSCALEPQASHLGRLQPAAGEILKLRGPSRKQNTGHKRDGRENSKSPRQQRPRGKSPCSLGDPLRCAAQCSAGAAPAAVDLRLRVNNVLHNPVLRADNDWAECRVVRLAHSPVVDRNPKESCCTERLHLGASLFQVPTKGLFPGVDAENCLKLGSLDSPLWMARPYRDRLQGVRTESLFESTVQGSTASPGVESANLALQALPLRSGKCPEFTGTPARKLSDLKQPQGLPSGAIVCWRSRGSRKGIGQAV